MSSSTSQVAAGTPSQTLLFDTVTRSYMGIRDRDETQFVFQNRSAWASMKRARQTLESWYSALPETKKRDTRGRFRNHDQHHLGALLELATHQLLLSLCTSVQVDPNFNNLTPDFSATYMGTDFVAECTVAQDSDQEIGATKRAEIVKKAIDSVDTGRFRLSCELFSTGPNQPATSELRRTLRKWVDSLDPVEEIRRRGQGYGPSELPWRKDGWDLRFEVIHVDSSSNGRKDMRAIQMDISGGGFRHDDASLKRALQGKSAKYSNLALPYLVVCGSGIEYADPQDLDKALFGHVAYVSHGQSIGVTVNLQPKPVYDGLFGSPSSPRSRQLSAILFKPRFGLWTLCGKDDPWLLIHNPWAQLPLPNGMFPFATEFIPKSGEFHTVEPTTTINKVLGLVDPWPGRDR